MKFFLPLLLATLVPTSSAQEVISVHGSGTTNPQKCYWDIMDKLMKQSKQPIRLTYRGVGSGNGQSDFIGDESTLEPYNDFGSGDIPLSQQQYDLFEPNSILHLPIVMGAISFFHSVPTGGKKLFLEPCVLAKILNREITDWTDDEITNLNPDLNLESPFPIRVVHRKNGSSSTASITAYLNQVCSAEWPDNLVGSTIVWKTDTEACEGSGGMTDCIRNEVGTIGYIDSGHGHAEGLQEIDLLNADGEYLSSKEAGEKNGILAAATEDAGIPPALDQSFANINLLNQPGASTWPIVAMTFIYVRKDLSYMSPESAGLLKGFLTALYRDEYTEICAEEFGFVPVTGDLRDKALDQIDSLITNGGANWTFEVFTQGDGVGQAENVFSWKRDSYSELEQDHLVSQVEALQRQLDEMKNGGGDGDSDGDGESGGDGSVPDHTHEFDFERDEELTAALILAAISFSLWIITLIFFCVKFVMRV
eukprot:scaffold22589_cov138-Cylindrotheca_fusiformis.AAC.45